MEGALGDENSGFLFGLASVATGSYHIEQALTPSNTLDQIPSFNTLDQTPTSNDDTITPIKTSRGQALIDFMIGHVEHPSEKGVSFSEDLEFAVSSLSGPQRCQLSSLASIILNACGSSVKLTASWEKKEEALEQRFEKGHENPIFEVTTRSEATSKSVDVSGPQTTPKIRPAGTGSGSVIVVQHNLSSEASELVPESVPTSMFQVDFETGSNPQDVEAETDAASDFSLRTSPNAHCTPEEADTVSKADIVATSYAGSKFAAVSDLQRPKGLGVAINSVENVQRDTVSKSKVISAVPARQVDSAAVSEPDNVTKPDTVSETKLATNAKAEVSIDKSPSSPTAKVVPNDVGFKLGLDRMSVDEFIQMARDQVEHFSFDYYSTGTNPAIFDSFIMWDGEAGPRWSKPDSELIDCITRADADRQKASLNYITTAIVFSREHQSRVRVRSKTGLPRQTASETVTNELLGKGVGSLQMQRCRIKNMLTRGKRWSLIVQKLGCGILLMNEWSLSKSTTKVVHEFIERILGSPDKMATLRFLSDQVRLMMDSRKTHPDQFHDQLVKEQLLLPDVVGETQLQRLTETAEQLAANQIVVKENGFQLDVKSLLSLEEGTWLNSDIILACLHLSKRESHVRVGFSIPTHTQTRSGVIQRPFQMASKTMKKWHSETSEKILVCLFVIFQRNNHFSLLEINEADNCIYHYDPQGREENGNIKRACKEEFSTLEYIEKETPQQNDVHSCGPLTIRNARCRMLGDQIIAGNVDNDDAISARAEAVDILLSALENGDLVPNTRRSTKRKRRGVGRAEGSKRRK